MWLFLRDAAAQGLGDLVAGIFLVWLAVRWEAQADTARDRVSAKRERAFFKLATKKR